VPSDFAFKTANALHRCVVTLTAGRLGWTASNMPVVQLTTVGRKSGQPHTVMLTSPVREGDAYVVVASRGGEDHHPAWLLNIQANPRVKVAVRGRTRDMTARVADAAERARLWPLVIADNKQYDAYQHKTTREIPLVILEPA
jgi:deazaflavin-dependent oxidoreductase (nitroreductase family)